MSDNRDRARAKWVFIGFVLIAGYFAIAEHKAHLSGILQYVPLLLVLACPLMHVFMHRNHGGHRHAANCANAPHHTEQR